ncbi:MAG TPA: c-type cytochrome [Burkholderiales bacterium]
MNKKLVWFAAAGALVCAPALAQDAQQLLKDKACLACHSLDNKVVGPAYKDVAKKFRARKDAESYLAKKIREGSTGEWGQIPMPPNTTVSEAEAHTLAKYILSLK